jgi:membrane-bound serine protease (ClpP class)
VRDSASITAEKALELKVIEIIAADLPDLLKKLDGREVNGKRLQTAGAAIREVPRTGAERIFQTLWRPEVMFLLMLAAMYGLIGEMSNPGAILPGVAGAIALILFLYMSAILPLDIAGVVLVILAIALFIIDIFAPTHGVLTAGGIISFFLGAMMMFQHSGPGFQLSLNFIVPATITTAASFIFVVGAGLRAQWLPPKTGREAMPGKCASTVTPVTPNSGKVFLEGELWNAVSDLPVAEGQSVEIVGIEGLTLKVRARPHTTKT